MHKTAVAIDDLLRDVAITDPSNVPAASIAALKAERRLVCEVDGISVLLLMTATGIVAVKNLCTHLNMPLDKGRMIAGQIHCPYHGACFDLATGRAMSGPAVTPLKRYAVTVEDDAIYLAAL
jgi:3-phenylpropionate/trans-cinnamate dioxygenase ferredoxin subunit